MKESELRTYCLEHAGEELPAEAIALLERDPELKRRVDQLIDVKKLISLKRHELPDKHSVSRCIAGVNEDIARRRLSLGNILREWIEFEPAAIRYAGAAAALVICAFGIGILSMRDTATEQVAKTEPSAEMFNAAPEPVVLTPEPVQDLVEAEREEPEFNKPIIVLRADPTNRHPASRSGMTIGGGQVMPVSFER